MRSAHPLIVAVLAVVLAGCVAAQTAPGPEAKAELAPTGKLRMGFLSTTPLHGTKDPVSGEFRGIAVELGKELARLIGVSFEPVPYTSIAALLAGAKTGAWDVATMGNNAERALILDFSAPYMQVQFSFLVPAGSSITSVNDVDQRGVRIAVLDKSSPDAYLSARIRNAALVKSPTIAGMVEASTAGKADALFATTAGLLSVAEKLPGSRLLDGSGGEDTAMGVPKGRPSGTAYVRTFVENAKSHGLVKAAIERAQLRGVVVAPLQ